MYSKSFGRGATVYQSLHHLISGGSVLPTNVHGLGSLREIPIVGPHQYFICDTCGQVFDIEGCSSVHVALPHDFLVRDLEVIIRGLCRDCCSK